MDITGKLAVAVVTRQETRIWATDATRGQKPETIHPAAGRHQHVREAQHHGGLAGLWPWIALLVASTAGLGTSFSITLPLNQVSQVSL